MLLRHQEFHVRCCSHHVPASVKIIKLLTSIRQKIHHPKHAQGQLEIKRNKNRSQDLRKVLVSSLGQLNLLRLHNRHQLFFFLKRQRKLGGGLIFFSPLACPRDFFFCPKKKPAPAMKARSFFVCQFKQNL